MTLMQDDSPRTSELDPVLAGAPHRIGRVTLAVRDLDRVCRFYEDVIGLSVLASRDGRKTLGVGSTALLELDHAPEAKLSSPRDAGLFHTAFLLPSRADLGAWLRHMAENRHAISGASDHIVSEAVYLSDPEGNGIEVYADRPSASWTRTSSGIAMSTERLDVQGVMASAHRPWAGLPTGSTVGHVHLQTGDLARAGAFYADLLGFDITARYPGALFYGSGGYHHQLASNIWNSSGAPHRSENTTGLRNVELIVRDRELFDAIRLRLEQAGVPVQVDASRLSVRDPWGTAFRLQLAD